MPTAFCLLVRAAPLPFFEGLYFMAINQFPTTIYRQKSNTAGVGADSSPLIISSENSIYTIDRNITKHDASGNLIWSKKASSDGTPDVVSALELKDRGIVLVTRGSYNSQISIINSDGSVRKEFELKVKEQDLLNLFNY